MSAVICGSLAYDTIMVFQDQFKNHILPDQVHILNVSFLVPRMRREFGGCAGNIAYNLKLLGGDPLPVAAVGQDFGPYREHLERNGIRMDCIRIFEDQFTPQCFITTDLDNNQITAFHPGAMQQSHLNKVATAKAKEKEIAIGIVAPDGRDGMIQHAEGFAAAGVPFIFDPGQALPLFDAKDLARFVEQATWVAANDYEWQLIQQKTGWTVSDVLQRVEALIVTRGADGSVIHTKGGPIEIPCAPTGVVVDPTGCGDAYRAGLIHGLLNGLDWPTTGRIASLMGAIKIESLGTQNHTFTPAEFKQRLTAFVEQ
jgi:adenosine kinase